MHFRERANVIQIIRIVYDPRTKRGKQDTVGSIPKKNLKISHEIKQNCSEMEYQEVCDWIERYKAFQEVELTYIAKKLPYNLSMAEEWFRIHAGSEEASVTADEIVAQFRQLRMFLKKKKIFD